MSNRIARLWRASGTGLRVGLILLFVDISVFLLKLLAGYAGLMTMEFSAAISRFWVSAHWPTHEFLAPMVWPHLPSHGAGWPGVIAMGVYMIGCGLHAFIVGFSLGHIAQFLFRHFRDAKA